MEDPLFKKKRGRRPKTHIEEEITEKKKRGRKKKYEIENFEKINNRNEDNNFNHNIAYSDDEETFDDTSVRKIAFGNLDITVSKKNNIEISESYKNIFNEKSKIILNEYSDDENEIVPIEKFLNIKQQQQPVSCEKNYSENQIYIPKIISECKEITSLKKMKVITCIKNLFDEIPEKTDIHCWWCCHQFKTCPCTLPVKHDPKTKKFDCIGIFCSWSCTKAYNHYNIEYKQKFQSMEVLNMMLVQLYGTLKTLSIKAAPPRNCLDMFGGYMNISEFRQNTEKTFRLNLVSTNFIYPEVTEILNEKVKKIDNKNLRLSRPTN